MKANVIRILRFATRKEFALNPDYRGFDPDSGILFMGHPGPKYYFMHDKVRYTVFRAKGSRLMGEYLGNPNGQVSLVRIEKEGFPLYQILSGEKPFLIETVRQTLPSGKIQEYGIYYYPSDKILIHY